MRINKSDFLKKKVKDTYGKGLQLFNDQELINMSQEKARKYLAEIDDWLRESSNVLDEDSAAEEERKRIEIRRKSSSNQEEASNFLVELVLELNDAATTPTPEMNTNMSEDSKSSSLLKNIELISSQIRSLGSMFEKRREQLRKSAYPGSMRPVQRVEPQLNNTDHLDSSSTTSKSMLSLIKRESMNKV